MAEGFHHTRNPKKYALRLAIGALIAEFPFDFSFYGHWTWQHQSVMVTLLLGFLTLMAMEKCPNLLTKAAVVIPFAVAAELLHTDYAWEGVALVALFGLARGMSRKWVILTAGMAVLFLLMSSARRVILGIRVPIQIFGLAALVPIALYSGKKTINSKAAQCAFYLFYPVHMLALRLIWIALNL